MINITLQLSQFEDRRVYNYYAHVPRSLADPFIEGQNRRIKCLIEGEIEIQSSLMPYPDGYFILINQQIISKLGLTVGDQFSIILEKDTSEYGMEMPEELQALLDQDKQANEYFHSLTPGKQRNLIYIVNQVKNSDSRLTKAFAIIDHLKEVNGKLEFRLLNEKIKEYNESKKLKL